MKVKDLIEELKKVDQELNVYVPARHGEYDYGFVNSADARLIYVMDDDENPPDEEVLVFLINEL